MPHAPARRSHANWTHRECGSTVSRPPNQPPNHSHPERKPFRGQCCACAGWAQTTKDGRHDGRTYDTHSASQPASQPALYFFVRPLWYAAPDVTATTAAATTTTTTRCERKEIMSSRTSLAFYGMLDALGILFIVEVVLGIKCVSKQMCVRLWPSGESALRGVRMKGGRTARKMAICQKDLI